MWDVLVEEDSTVRTIQCTKKTINMHFCYVSHITKYSPWPVFASGMLNIGDELGLPKLLCRRFAVNKQQRERAPRRERSQPEGFA